MNNVPEAATPQSKTADTGTVRGTLGVIGIPWNSRTPGTGRGGDEGRGSGPAVGMVENVVPLTVTVGITRLPS